VRISGELAFQVALWRERIPGLGSEAINKHFSDVKDTITKGESIVAQHTLDDFP
jgi:hypothetical protein